MNIFIIGLMNNLHPHSLRKKNGGVNDELPENLK